MGNGFEAYDVSNPSAPIWLSTTKIDGRYFCSTFDHWRIAVSGNTAYLSSAYNGVFVYDVKNPASPRRIDKVTINIPVGGNGYSKITNPAYLFSYDQDDHGQSLVTSVTPINGYYYITSNTGDKFKDYYKLTDEKRIVGKRKGLYVIELKSAKKVKNESSESKITNSDKKPKVSVPSIDGFKTKLYQTDGIVFGMAKYKDNYIFAEGSHGFSIYQNNMKKVKTYSSEGCVKDVVVTGDYLYTSESGVGISVYKLSSKDAKYIGTYKTESINDALSCLQLSPDNNYLFAQTGLYSYTVLNISDRENIVKESTVNTGSMYERSFSFSKVGGNKIGVVNRNSVIWYREEANGALIQMLNKANPYYSERCGLVGYGEYAIQIFNNGYVYYKPEDIASDKYQKMATIVVDGAELVGTPNVIGNMLVVSDSCGRCITIVDITNIDKPVLITKVETDGNPSIVYSFGDELLISLSHSGLLKCTKK